MIGRPSKEPYRVLVAASIRSFAAEASQQLRIGDGRGQRGPEALRRVGAEAFTAADLFEVVGYRTC